MSPKLSEIQRAIVALRRWNLRRLVPALLLLTVALSAVPTVPSYADPTPAGSPDFVAIDAYISQEMRDVRIPGLALGIVHNDEIAHLRGFGLADASGRSVTPQTPFILASASKSFTALAIMQLVDDRKVDLDAPVVTYLPSFRVGDESASATITVRHLLNHTSGLPESTAYEPMLSNDMSDDALSERVGALSDVDLDHGVGEAFEYTDANYDTLGLIVQTVSGQTYESRIQDRIFTPLGMSNSFTNQTDARKAGMASGHRSWFGFPRPFEAPYSRAAMPSSYLISSAEDITHFLSGQLNGGTYDGASVLSPGGIAAMHQPAVREGDRDIFYGMGWESRTLAGVPVVRHKGTNANFYADMVLDKDGGWGIVILANFDSLNFNGGRVQGLSAGVLSLLRGEAPPDEPMPHHPLLASATLITAVVTVLMLTSMVWSLATMRRWHTQTVRRPGRPWVLGLRVALSSVICIGWGLGLLLIFPALAYPLAPTLLIVPDLGYLIVISSVVALLWGIARPPLTYVTLRHRNG